MQAGVRVVRVLINRALRSLSCDPLIVEFGGHLGAALINPTHTSLNLREALSMSLQSLRHLPSTIAYVHHLCRKRADLVRYDPHGLDRAVEIIPHVRIVVVSDFLVCALRRVAGLRRSRGDVREASVKSPANVAQARDSRRGGRTNDGDNRRDDRCDDLRVGDDVNHRRDPTVLSAHPGPARRGSLRRPSPGWSAR